MPKTKVQPVGRPEKEIDKKLFENLMSIPFAKETNVAECLGCSVSTLSRWIKDNYQINFEELKKQKWEGLKMRLEGKQFDVAMKGSIPMLIWLGKQHLGQADKQETKLAANINSNQETPQQQLERLKDMVKDEK